MKKETCFYWGKRKYTTCTFILKVFTLLFDQSARSRNSFCFEALTSGHNSSVLYGETGDRDIFSAFVFGPCFNRPNTNTNTTTTTGRRYQKRALPAVWCLRRRLPCWPRAPGGPGQLHRVQCWPRGSQQRCGASCGSSVCINSKTSWEWTDREARTSRRWFRGAVR